MPEQPKTSPGDLMGEQDHYLFRKGSHTRLYESLGAHPVSHEGSTGVRFAVWAPAAKYVSVVGSFNDWDPKANPLESQHEGIWSGFVPEVSEGALYKFHIVSKIGNHRSLKADPFGRLHEEPPRTASVVWNSEFKWNDQRWLKKRKKKHQPDAPVSIYELHLGSFKRNDAFLNYRELAEPLIEHVKKLGFTHIEFMPICEHPYFASWGYQTTGYFAPTSRYGTPEDLKYLIDRLHQENIGVLLDWVPSHFPTDAHGLGFFDGTHLFEHADPRQGFHPDWKSLIFNYNRGEVCSFLLSSAHYWLREFHFDGIRVDAVASMLYLDYSRDEGEWIPNKYGGRENLEAITFLRSLNEHVKEEFPDVLMVAEESTAWPSVTQPAHIGGLGFDLKWDLGWMHDSLKYFAVDPLGRKYHQNQLTFRQLYAGSENFLLPLSHDEVVHGKGSLLGKMHGDLWQKFANLRALLGWQYAQPGKKLLFMGSELASLAEWNHDRELPWHLLERGKHQGMFNWVSHLNKLYRKEPALYESDHHAEGFRWIDCTDFEQSVLILARQHPQQDDVILAVLNLTPVPREHYRVGVPTLTQSVPTLHTKDELEHQSATDKPKKNAKHKNKDKKQKQLDSIAISDTPTDLQATPDLTEQTIPSQWLCIACSDEEKFGGTGVDMPRELSDELEPMHGCDRSIVFRLPPLSITFFKRKSSPKK